MVITRHVQPSDAGRGMTSSATAEIRPRAEAHTAGVFVAIMRKVGCNGSYGVEAIDCGAVLGECAAVEVGAEATERDEAVFRDSH